MADIDFNTDEWEKGFNRLDKAVTDAMGKALMNIGDELLRLSTFEIPHKDGLLQASGEIEHVSDTELLVGYNKVYAAYQHEGDWPDGSHVIHNHSKPGRKTKYLIDPLQMNVPVFEKYLGEALSTVF